MFFASLSRAEINALFQGHKLGAYFSEAPSVEAALNRIPDRDPFAAFWPLHPHDEGSLPGLIVTPVGASRELLAWLATYANHIRPATAFVRVVEADLLSQLAVWSETPRLQRLPAFVGVVLGEILTALEPSRRTRPDDVNVASGLTTLSFSLSRACAMYGSRSDLSALCRSWTTIRRITSQRERKVAVGYVQEVVTALSAATSEDTDGRHDASDFLVEACRDLARDGRLSPGARAFHVLDSVVPGFASLMSGPREERLGAFEKLAHAVLPDEREEARRVASFLIGYAGSCLAPGTLAHAPLLNTYLDGAPGALLWYGACAGLANETTILAEMGGLGRRIARELVVGDGLLDPPRADISALELEVLFQEEEPNFVRSATSHVTVELMPGVTTTLAWPPRDRGRAPAEPEFSVRDRLALARDVHSVVSRLSDVYSRLMGMDDNDRDLEPEQQTLFGDPKRRNRKGR